LNIFNLATPILNAAAVQAMRMLCIERSAYLEPPPFPDSSAVMALPELGIATANYLF